LAGLSNGRENTENNCTKKNRKMRKRENKTAKKKPDFFTGRFNKTRLSFL